METDSVTPSSFSVLRDSLKDLNESVYQNVRQSVPSISYSDESSEEESDDDGDVPEIVFSGIDYEAMDAAAKVPLGKPVRPAQSKDTRASSSNEYSITDARKQFKEQQMERVTTEKAKRATQPASAVPKHSPEAEAIMSDLSNTGSYINGPLGAATKSMPAAKAPARAAPEPPPPVKKAASPRESKESSKPLYEMDTSGWLAGAAGRMASLDPSERALMREKRMQELVGPTTSDVDSSAEQKQVVEELKEVEEAFADVIARGSTEDESTWTQKSDFSLYALDAEEDQAAEEGEEEHSILGGIDLDDLLARLTAPGGLVYSSTYEGEGNDAEDEAKLNADLQALCDDPEAEEDEEDEEEREARERAGKLPMWKPQQPMHQAEIDLRNELRAAAGYEVPAAAPEPKDKSAAAAKKVDPYGRVPRSARKAQDPAEDPKQAVKTSAAMYLDLRAEASVPAGMPSSLEAGESASDGSDSDSSVEEEIASYRAQRRSARPASAGPARTARLSARAAPTSGRPQFKEQPAPPAPVLAEEPAEEPEEEPTPAAAAAPPAEEEALFRAPLKAWSNGEKPFQRGEDAGRDGAAARKAAPKAVQVEVEEEEEDIPEEEDEDAPEPEEVLSPAERQAKAREAERERARAAARKQEEEQEREKEARRQEAIRRHKEKAAAAAAQRTAAGGGSAGGLHVATAWTNAIEAAAPHRSLFHSAASLTPVLPQLPPGVAMAELFCLKVEVGTLAALPQAAQWLLSQGGGAATAAPAAFRVVGLYLAAAAADSNALVLHAVAMDAAVNGGARKTGAQMARAVGACSIEPVQCSVSTEPFTGKLPKPCLQARAPFKGEVDPAAETTVSVMRGGAGDAAAAVGAVLSRAGAEGLDVVALRIVWPAPEQAAALAAFSPHRLPGGGGGAGTSAAGPAAPALALALRGRNAVARWQAAAGPEDPALARRTDPRSLRALHGGASRAENLLSCSHTAPSAARELAFLFGGRLPPTAFPKRNAWKPEPEAVPLVVPQAVERSWVVLHPALPAGAVAAVLAECGRAGLHLVQLARTVPPDALDMLGLPSGRAALLACLQAENACLHLQALKGKLLAAAGFPHGGTVGGAPVVYVPATPAAHRALRVALGAGSGACAGPSAAAAERANDQIQAAQPDPATPADVAHPACVALQPDDLAALARDLQALIGTAEDGPCLDVVGLRLVGELPAGLAAEALEAVRAGAGPARGPAVVAVLHGPHAVATVAARARAARPRAGPPSCVTALSPSMPAARRCVAELFREQDIQVMTAGVAAAEAAPRSEAKAAAGGALYRSLLCGPPLEDAVALAPLGEEGQASVDVLLRVATKAGCVLGGLRVLRGAAAAAAAAPLGTALPALPAALLVVHFRRQNAIGCLSEVVGQKVDGVHVLGTAAAVEEVLQQVFPDGSCPALAAARPAAAPAAASSGLHQSTCLMVAVPAGGLLELAVVDMLRALREDRFLIQNACLVRPQNRLRELRQMSPDFPAMKGLEAGSHALLVLCVERDNAISHLQMKLSNLRNKQPKRGALASKASIADDVYSSASGSAAAAHQQLFFQ